MRRVAAEIRELLKGTRPHRSAVTHLPHVLIWGMSLTIQGHWAPSVCTHSPSSGTHMDMSLTLRATAAPWWASPGHGTATVRSGQQRASPPAE